MLKCERFSFNLLILMESNNQRKNFPGASRDFPQDLYEGIRQINTFNFADYLFCTPDVGNDEAA